MYADHGREAVRGDGEYQDWLFTCRNDGSDATHTRRCQHGGVPGGFVSGVFITLRRRVSALLLTPAAVAARLPTSPPAINPNWRYKFCNACEDCCRAPAKGACDSAKFCVNKLGYGSTSDGRQIPAIAPGLNKVDAVFGAADNYELICWT